MARAFVLAFCVVFSFATPLLVDVVGAQPAEPARYEYTEGEALYLRDCSSCHGVAGEGTSRGVPLQDAGAAGAHYYLSTGRMPIDHPEDRIERAPPHYSESAIDQLVEYVASLGDGPEIPDVSDDGDVSTGGSLFRLHCAQCHGSSGVGVALAADVVAPSLLESSRIQVAEALVVGPGAMPVFHPAVFSDDEMDAVVAYVDQLKASSDVGGLPMARAGRVDELLAAWAAGAALVFAGRAIARRR